jgi:hypothetical protein
MTATRVIRVGAVTAAACLALVVPVPRADAAPVSVTWTTPASGAVLTATNRVAFTITPGTSGGLLPTVTEGIRSWTLKVSYNGSPVHNLCAKSYGTPKDTPVTVDFQWDTRYGGYAPSACGGSAVEPQDPGDPMLNANATLSLVVVRENMTAPITSTQTFTRAVAFNNPPDTPTGVAAFYDGANQANVVTWNANGEADLRDYVVQECHVAEGVTCSEPDWTTVAFPSPTATFHPVPVSGAGAYRFRVSARRWAYGGASTLTSTWVATGAPIILYDTTTETTTTTLPPGGGGTGPGNGGGDGNPGGGGGGSGPGTGGGFDTGPGSRTGPGGYGPGGGGSDGGGWTRSGTRPGSGSGSGSGGGSGGLQAKPGFERSRAGGPNGGTALDGVRGRRSIPPRLVKIDEIDPGFEGALPYGAKPVGDDRVKGPLSLLSSEHAPALALVPVAMGGAVLVFALQMRLVSRRAASAAAVAMGDAVAAGDAGDPPDPDNDEANDANDANAEGSYIRSWRRWLHED